MRISDSGRSVYDLSYSADLEGFGPIISKVEIKLCLLILLLSYFTELHDIQVVEEDDLRDGELYFTNEGQITKCTDGTLVGVGFTIAIDLPLPAGVFVCFPGCIIIQHPDVRHLKEGDKGSGILTKKPNQPYKPFGIALAVLKCTKQTAVCNMREIFKEFDFFVYEK